MVPLLKFQRPGARSNLEIVKYYRDVCGLNVMPLGSRKIPKLKWGAYQLAIIPEAIIEKHFGDPWTNPSGIGVICGCTSGNVELLDFEDDTLFQWLDQIEDELGYEVRNSFPIVATPSGGFHVYYRCPVIEGNLKLAYDADGDILIETRGQGGQAVMPGSPGCTHPSGKLYKLAKGSFDQIPTLSVEVRDVYLEMARTFNKIPPVVPKFECCSDCSVKGDRPGDDFNARGDWKEILEPKGWYLVRQTNRVEYWCRPGKHDGGFSATIGHCCNDEGQSLLYVFSSSAAPFEAEKAYNKFSAYTLLYHSGDFHFAAERLAAMDYGYSGTQTSLMEDEEAIHKFFMEKYQ